MTYMSHQTLLRLYCVLEGVSHFIRFQSLPFSSQSHRSKGLGRGWRQHWEMATIVLTLNSSLHFKRVITMMMSPSTSKCKIKNTKCSNRKSAARNYPRNLFCSILEQISSLLKKISLLFGNFILVTLTSNGMSSHQTVVCSVIEILILVVALPSNSYGMTK